MTVSEEVLAGTPLASDGAALAERLEPRTGLDALNTMGVSIKSTRFRVVISPPTLAQILAVSERGWRREFLDSETSRSALCLYLVGLYWEAGS